VEDSNEGFNLNHHLELVVTMKQVRGGFSHILTRTYFQN